jgi:hypothetical protein
VSGIDLSSVTAVIHVGIFESALVIPTLDASAHYSPISVHESTSGIDTSHVAFIFSKNVTESVSGIDTVNASVAYEVLIESASGIDTTGATVIHAVSVIESAPVADMPNALAKSYIIESTSAVDTTHVSSATYRVTEATSSVEIINITQYRAIDSISELMRISDALDGDVIHPVTSLPELNQAYAKKQRDQMTQLVQYTYSIHT